MVTFSVETMTPEEAARLVENRHPRYKDFSERVWNDGHTSQNWAKRMAKGFRPFAVIDGEGRLFDGAIQMSGLPVHGEPIECAVIRYAEGEDVKTYPVTNFPEGWEDRNKRVCIENPSQYEINELDEAQAAYNGDLGIRCVQDIVLYLRRDDYESAKNVRQNEGDKTRMYPDVEYKLLILFGCRCHGVHGCDNWLCKKD